ncbi:MAG: tetratricopeptide repeat protein [Thermodesulfovibrionales bacterium]|jgi:tetratricopeptide (TPR) repeat protein
MSDKSAIIKEAQKYLARGQIEKAIGEWEKLVKEYPDGNAYNTVGDLYLKKGDRTDAVESFHKAASYFKQEGFALKALALYKKILNLIPNDAIALFSLGELNEGKGLTTDAIKFYLAAADTLSKEGKKEKILEIYDRILALSPSNIPLRNKVAEIYARDGLMSEAAKQYLHVAGLYSDKEEMEKAIIFYRKVLDIQPVNKQAIIGTAVLNERIGNLAKAIEQMKEAITLFPEDAEILLKCAELHIMAEKFDEALGYLRQVVVIEPANIRARRLIGDIYIKQGDRGQAWAEYLPLLDEMILEEKYEDAINLLESFKDIDPLETGKRLVSLYRQINEQDRVVGELVSLGDIFSSKGMKKEALNCYREAFTLSPDNEPLRTKVIEYEKDIAKKSITIEAEKPVDEAIMEADIYLRYGLFDNARDILEAFKTKEPDNVTLHLKLKSLYTETGNKEMAVTECIVLSDLYKEAGEIEKKEEIIKDAYAIDPDDPRLAGLIPPSHEKPEVKQPEGPFIEDYSEEMSEAAFYARQGLLDEAREILERLQSLFPDNEDISQRLGTLGQMPVSEVREDWPPEAAPKEAAMPEETLEVEELTEPALDSDVLDIFNEFKKGLEKELEEEDYETHYNLGIAYKEMGLIDDAIREFQASRNDPKRFIHSSNMLGICYIEKGLYQLAVDVLITAIDTMEDRGESYWAMKYDLADAYEKNGNMKEALDTYTNVYGWNSKFRAVSEKIDQLKTRMVDTTEKKTKDRKDRVSYL